LHTLHLAKKTNGEIDIPNAVNSIMRGISISDSEPINRKHAALSRKLDLHTDGHINELNVVRQCIAPQTMISFRLTLDQSILQNTITAAAIQDAVKRFDQFYYKTYVKKFPQEENFDEFKEAELFILLGGGSGYFDKNLVYPFYAADEKRAVREVSDMFRNQRMFKKHRHEKDVQLGISPRVQKLTEYDENYYAMGLCTVSIQ
jgi:CRISPR-associated protein Csm5